MENPKYYVIFRDDVSVAVVTQEFKDFLFDEVERLDATEQRFTVSATMVDSAYEAGMLFRRGQE